MSNGLKTFCVDAEQMDFRSRIFIDNQWHEVLFEDGCSIASYPQLHIQWHSETLDEWSVLSATLENRGDESISLGAFPLGNPC